MPIGQITTPEIEQVGRPDGHTGSASQLEQNRPISAKQNGLSVHSGGQNCTPNLGFGDGREAESQSSEPGFDRRFGQAPPVMRATFASPWIFGYPT